MAKLQTCIYRVALRFYKDREYLQALALLDSAPEDTKDISSLRIRSAYQAGKTAGSRGEYREAIELLDRVADYSDAASLGRGYRLALAEELVAAENWEEALPLLEELGSYRNARRLLRQVNAALEAREAEAENDASDVDAPEENTVDEDGAQGPNADEENNAPVTGSGEPWTVEEEAP